MTPFFVDATCIAYCYTQNIYISKPETKQTETPTTYGTDQVL